MNTKKPVQLSQKIDYLNQKIFKVHSIVRKSDDFQLRLNFQQYIDNCIREIIVIKDTASNNGTGNFILDKFNSMTSQPVNKNTVQQNSESGKLYSTQSQKLQYQKKIINYQMKQLQNRQLQLQYQTLKMKLFNKQKQIQKLQYQKDNLIQKNNQQIKKNKQKNKFIEQQIQKLIKLNKAQQEQIKKVKQERNRAQMQQMQIQQKYDNDIGKLEKFGDKKPRYIDRTTQGLKCTHHYVNTGTVVGNNTHKIILLKLPTILQVNKLVYGIMLGIQVSNKQIMYYDKIQLYEKQITQIQLQHQKIVLTYKRRKQNTRVVLDKFIVRTPEIVVMLYGKGDSILVHDQVIKGKIENANNTK